MKSTILNTLVEGNQTLTSDKGTSSFFLYKPVMVL